MPQRTCVDQHTLAAEESRTSCVSAQAATEERTQESGRSTATDASKFTVDARPLARDRHSWAIRLQLPSCFPSCPPLIRRCIDWIFTNFGAISSASRTTDCNIDVQISGMPAREQSQPKRRKVDVSSKQTYKCSSARDIQRVLKAQSEAGLIEGVSHPCPLSEELNSLRRKA